MKQIGKVRLYSHAQGRWRHRAQNLIHLTKTDCLSTLATQDGLVVYLRYGVVANIAVSHTAAGGSIPPIGVSFFFFFLHSLSSHLSIVSQRKGMTSNFASLSVYKL